MIYSIIFTNFGTKVCIVYGVNLFFDFFVDDLLGRILNNNVHIVMPSRHNLKIRGKKIQATNCSGNLNSVVPNKPQI